MQAPDGPSGLERRRLSLPPAHLSRSSPEPCRMGRRLMMPYAREIRISRPDGPSSVEALAKGFARFPKDFLVGKSLDRLAIRQASSPWWHREPGICRHGGRLAGRCRRKFSARRFARARSGAIRARRLTGPARLPCAFLCHRPCPRSGAGRPSSSWRPGPGRCC